MSFKDTFFSKKQTLNCRGKIRILDKPLIMGILNVTPDSFYKTSQKTSVNEAFQHAEKMIHNGADIIDVGAYSSRPGAEDISEKEESDRLIPVIDKIRTQFPEIIISVDTFRSHIAKIMIEEYDVDMINDISAGSLDPDMFHVISGYNVPYVLMHMKGNPQNMQQNAHYKDVTKEIMMFFSEKLHLLKSLGIHDVILDPGFGFGKTIAHNFELLHNLKNFHIFELPLMVGLSRKSMIYKTINQLPENALTGTIVLQTIALQQGVNILRVHDVQEASEMIQIFKEYNYMENRGGQIA